VSASRVSAGLAGLADLLLASRELSPRVAALAVRYAAVLGAGRTLFFCGNGGSAADAQHLATEYVVRYSRARPGLAALALTTDTSVLTAAGNDLGFEQIFARQVEALGRAGDLLVLHSTSGRSANLLAAARAARARSVGTVAFLGRGGGPLAAEVDDAIVVPSDDTSRIQLLHLALEHVIVELVEDELLPAR
jgi:D-sedoheptulose 7-phosphate isomerase